MIEVVGGIGDVVLPVPLRTIGLQLRWDPHRRAAQSEGEEDLLTEEVVVARPRGAGDDISEDAVAQVGVPEAFARGGHQVPVAHDRLVHGRRTRRLVGVEEVVVHGETGGVIGNPANGRLAGVAHPGPEPSLAEVVVNRPIQVDHAALDQDHERRRREGLGHRGDGVQRVLGGRDHPLPVRQPEPLLPQDLPIARDRDREGRDDVLDEGLLDAAGNRVKLRSSLVRLHSLDLSPLLAMERYFQEWQAMSPNFIPHLRLFNRAALPALAASPRIAKGAIPVRPGGRRWTTGKTPLAARAQRHTEPRTEAADRRPARDDPAAHAPVPLTPAG
jgi:hypothetical protein